MATNEFKAFATAGGANVLSQEEYLALAALSTGFQSGIAKSAEINKALRQATTGVAALTQFISEATNSDINDDGNVSALVAKLTAALAARGLSRENPFADIAADGTVDQALANLGLGEGSALPVGVPVPWPSATPPIGWLKCNGAAFDKSKYPTLALAYPSGKLPDLRGEFIRGWDDGRGVDGGRGLLTYQSGSSLGRFAGNVDSTAYIYADNYDYSEAGSATWSKIVATVTRELGQTVYRGARPRNIAFNHIVRAA